MFKNCLIFSILVIVMSFVRGEAVELPQETLDCLNGAKPMFMANYNCLTKNRNNQDKSKECAKTSSDLNEQEKLCGPKLDALNSAQKEKVQSIVMGWMNEEFERSSEFLDCFNELDPLAIKYLDCLAKYNYHPKTTDEKEECKKLGLDMFKQFILCSPKLQNLNSFEEYKFRNITNAYMDLAFRRNK